MCEVPQLTDLDLTGIDTVAIDLETYDPNLKTKGLGAVRKDGFVQAGAGIVSDSIPNNELKETEHKANAMLIALREASK